MAQILRTNFDHEDVEPKNGTDFQLGETYRLIGCELIEHVYLLDENGESNGELLVIDEEGRLVDNPVLNVRATELFWKGRMPLPQYNMYAAQLNLFGSSFVNKNQLDCIVGDCLHCKIEEIK